MSSIVTGLREAILADATVAGLIKTRLYAKRLPQNPIYPAATMERIDGDPGNTLNSVSTLKRARIRVNSWGTKYSEAEGLAQAIEAAINGQKYEATGIAIRSVVADGMRDFFEPNVEAHYISQDFRIFYRET